jgi:predicted glycosyltransferase
MKKAELIRNEIYYFFKPLIPRRLQISLRRKVIQFQVRKYKDIWPIDEAAGNGAEGSKKWPDNKKFALVLTHDVETARGHAKCLELAAMEERLGFRSSFNFVPLRYKVSPEKRAWLRQQGFEVGVHGLWHDGKYYRSRKQFQARAKIINQYLSEWQCSGYRAPCMIHKLDWFHDLNIEYDSSTFDTDPFEPYSRAVGTIFPFFVECDNAKQFYVELPYTLPQDFTLFVLMQENNIDIWKNKLDWVANRGGMVLVNAHPDYMKFDSGKLGLEEYPARYYEEFLGYIKSKYEGQYWNALPQQVSRFWSEHHGRRSRRIKITEPSFGGMVGSVGGEPAVRPALQPEVIGTQLNAGERKSNCTISSRPKKVWIDLDNSPHVPFFRPIIRELENRGYSMFLTARDCFQTCELADASGLHYQRIGHHYGKNIFLKLAGLVIRSLQMAPLVWRERPDLAVSHGSRSQHLTSFLWRLPVINIMDYEHAKILPLVNFVRIAVPDVIPNEAVPIPPERILKYPGIKEDVYVPGFQPDPSLIDELGISREKIVIVIRPPATEAHYRNAESDILFEKTIQFLSERADTCLVILPRNDKQKAWIIDQWPGLCKEQKIIFPQKVVNGLNLIWCSDLVISGGGTMNREAAALGVPVYSIFRGKTGAVDRYLAAQRRLFLIESPDDISHKIKVGRRQRTGELVHTSTKALNAIVDGIETVLQAQRL